MRGYILSDLHLFSRRSVAETHHDSILAAVRDSDILVLNGDIFDFRWSRYSNLEESIEAAYQWLRKLLMVTSHCTVHYVLGNHDSLPLFVEKLREVSAASANFQWHSEYLRIGSHLFLHGDIVNMRAPSSQGLEERRDRFNKRESRSALLESLYLSVVLLGLHRVPSLFYSKATLAERILQYLSSVDGEMIEEIRAVYFGHTHAPFEAYQYRGIHFYNTGAAIRGIPFRPLEVMIG